MMRRARSNGERTNMIEQVLDYLAGLRFQAHDSEEAAFAAFARTCPGACTRAARAGPAVLHSPGLLRLGAEVDRDLE